jgi:hypothetical protein
MAAIAKLVLQDIPGGIRDRAQTNHLGGFITVADTAVFQHDLFLHAFVTGGEAAIQADRV